MLCIYADYKSDESYTPSKISVRVGNNFHNLQEIRVMAPPECLSAWWLMRAAADFLLGFLFPSAAAGDGGAQWMDSYLADEPGKTVIPPSRPPVAC